jgi:hypothetical protein
MPTVVDVDEIHTPKYEPTTMHVEEEQNASQEVGQSEENAERTESDASRGKGSQKEEQAMGSIQQGLEQGLEPKEGHETERKAIPEVGVSSPQGKKKAQAERSAQGVQCAQMELAIVMPKITKGVKVDDEMVGGVDTIKYFDHDVVDTVKFPDLAPQNYLESRGEGPLGVPLLEPT